MSDQTNTIKETTYGLGVVISEFIVSNELINNLNNLIDKKLKENSLISKGHSLAGQIENEFDIFQDLDDSLVKELNLYISHYLTMTGEMKKIKKYNLVSCWFNDQKENEYNPLHIHWGESYGGISSVLFLKIPDSINQAKNKNNKEEPKDGRLEFVYGNTLYCSHNTKLVHPQVGKLYLFPYYLNHTVYPFKGEGVRRSLSFNVDLIK